MAASQELISEIILEENENTILYIHLIKRKLDDNFDYFVCLNEHRKTCDIGPVPTGNMVMLYKKEFDVLVPLVEISRRFCVSFDDGKRFFTLCKVGNESLYEIYLEKKEGKDNRLLIQEQALKNLFDLRYEIEAGFEEDVSESTPEKNKPSTRAYFYQF